MLDHVSITVSDLERTAPFWDAVMAALGVPCVWRQSDAIGYGVRNGPDDDSRTYLTIRLQPGALAGTFESSGRHWCFRAADHEAVGLFHAAGIAHGGICDGPPGFRPQYHPSYYAAFLVDPDGNRIEAVCHRCT